MDRNRIRKKARRGTLTASRKAKGRSFQKQIRDLFIALGDSQVMPDDIVSRGMGQAGEDIQFFGSSKNLFPFYAECKAHRTGFNPHRIMEELEEKTDGTGHYPLLFHKKDRGKALVTMTVGTFELFAGLMVRHREEFERQLITFEDKK